MDSRPESEATFGLAGRPAEAALFAPGGPDADSTGFVEEVALMQDAAAVLAARQRLDALLLQLAATPFDAAACHGMRAYLAGPVHRAQAAYARLCAAAGPRAF